MREKVRGLAKSSLLQGLRTWKAICLICNSSSAKPCELLTHVPYSAHNRQRRGDQSWRIVWLSLRFSYPIAMPDFYRYPLAQLLIIKVDDKRLLASCCVPKPFTELRKAADHAMTAKLWRSCVGFAAARRVQAGLARDDGGWLGACGFPSVAFTARNCRNSCATKVPDVVGL